MIELILTTDSTCDINPKLLKELDLKVARIPYFVNGEEFSHETGKTLSKSDFYARMREGADIKTSMINEHCATEFLEEHLKTNKDVLYIGLSSGLSGTYQSFVNAANNLNQEYKNQVYVIDSQSGSGGISIMLEQIFLKAKTAKTIKEVIEYAHGLATRVSSIFTVDDLKHLLKGGRISKAAAVIGSILSIKPIVYSNNEGKLASLCKVISRKKSIIRLFELFRDNYNSEFKKVYVTHADCASDAEHLAKLINNTFPEVEVVQEIIDVTLGSHCGPGCLSIFFTTDKK